LSQEMSVCDAQSFQFFPAISRSDFTTWSSRMWTVSTSFFQKTDLDHSFKTSTLQYTLEINQIAQVLRKNRFRGIMNGGVFEAKALRNFYANSASCSLFWRVFAGCSGMNRRKEKPLECCVIPTV